MKIQLSMFGVALFMSQVASAAIMPSVPHTGEQSRNIPSTTVGEESSKAELPKVLLAKKQAKKQYCGDTARGCS